MNTPQIFDVYFASIVSMQFHPGAGSKEHAQLNLAECAEIALKMIQIRKTLLDEGMI